MRHTKGPWLMKLSDNATPCIRHSNCVDVDCHNHLVCWLPAEITQSYNSLDNARLIAAAPDMLKALEPFAEIAKHRVADAPEWSDKTSLSVMVSIGELREVVAAIAKAKGEG